MLLSLLTAVGVMAPFGPVIETSASVKVPSTIGSLNVRVNVSSVPPHRWNWN